jgi:surfactin synthase thioesterase subunit
MRYLRSWTRADPATDLVVVFPPAGSGCMRLRSVAEGRPADRVVVGVQLPGREDRLAEPMPATLDHGVAAIAAELRVLPRRRLGLLGISLGGLLAFAVARMLEKSQAAADDVCVAAARSPQFWRSYQADPSDAEIDAMLGFAWRASPMGAYAADVLRRDLRLAADYDIGQAVLEHTPLRVVSGRHDVVAAERQMAAWQTCSAHYRGQSVLDADHQQFLDKEVLDSMIDDMFARVHVREEPC